MGGKMSDAWGIKFFEDLKKRENDLSMMTKEEKKEIKEIVKLLEDGVLTDEKLNEACNRLNWFKVNWVFEKKPVFKELH